jgi:hypothetical protein
MKIQEQISEFPFKLKLHLFGLPAALMLDCDSIMFHVS